MNTYVAPAASPVTDVSEASMLKEGVRCLVAEIRRLERSRASEVAMDNEAEAAAYKVRIDGLVFCRGILEDVLDG